MEIPEFHSGLERLHIAGHRGGASLNGTYIRLVLEFNTENPEVIEELKSRQFFILSTLFPHETKLSVMHYKIQRHFENMEPVPSKQEVLIHCGFRMFTVKPVFS